MKEEYEIFQNFFRTHTHCFIDLEYKAREATDEDFENHFEHRHRLSLKKISQTGKANMWCINSKTNIFSQLQKFYIPCLTFKCRNVFEILFFFKKECFYSQIEEVMNRIKDIFEIEEEREDYFDVPFYEPCEYIDYSQQNIRINEYIIQEMREKETSLEGLTDIINTIPYQDAPPCIRNVLISANFGKEKERAITLKNIGLYFRLKYPFEWSAKLKSLNKKYCIVGLADYEYIESILSASITQYDCDFGHLQCKCNKNDCAKKGFGYLETLGFSYGNSYYIQTRYGRTYIVEIIKNGEIHNLKIKSASFEKTIFYKELENQVGIFANGVKNPIFEEFKKTVIENAIASNKTFDYYIPFYAKVCGSGEEWKNKSIALRALMKSFGVSVSENTYPEVIITNNLELIEKEEWGKVVLLYDKEYWKDEYIGKVKTILKSTKEQDVYYSILILKDKDRRIESDFMNHYLSRPNAKTVYKTSKIDFNFKERVYYFREIQIYFSKAEEEALYKYFCMNNHSEVIGISLIQSINQKVGEDIITI